ncbi:MAG: DUF3786 domain-containing protein [Nitrospiraceae bacterium]|nr:DUF3786 domain-containing protein [Nitrospiraceae bacterium]
MKKALEHTIFAPLAERVGALYDETEDALLLGMFGQDYVVRRSGITLRGQPIPESHEAVIIDYLLSSGSVLIDAPWRSLGDLLQQSTPDFRSRVELPLSQHIEDILSHASAVLPLCDARQAASAIGGDMAISVRALPKVHLHVELQRQSQEFPPEAWVLFSNNADRFLSAAGLLLLGELFKDRILSLIRIY